MWKINKFQLDYRDARNIPHETEIRKYHDFLEYTALGWIRPDKLPVSFQMRSLKNQWFDFFESLSYGRSEVGNYKVSGGIFKTYEHYEKYIVSGFSNLKKSIEISRYQS